MSKTKIIILANEDPYDHQPWVDACEEFNDRVEYRIVNIAKENWLEEINKDIPDICLIKPAGKTSTFRTLYQERVEILVRDLGLKIFPSYDELRIYENKRYFAYWAMANKVNHPRTWVFYDKKEAKSFLKNASYPIVGKLNVGASGNGIRILKNTEELSDYIDLAFSSGLVSKTGPKLNKGKLVKRIWNKLTNPKKLINRLKTYSEIAADKQKGFLILQKFIQHDFEWRAVRIGDSFFAHKKIKVGEKASGALIKGYDNPPLELFDYVKKLTDELQFKSVAVDIFGTNNNEYLVNEIQCIFGQSDPHQMLIDNIPGRYISHNNKWKFEEGDFNKNQSYNLRLEYILNKMQ